MNPPEFSAENTITNENVYKKNGDLKLGKGSIREETIKLVNTLLESLKSQINRRSEDKDDW